MMLFNFANMPESIKPTFSINIPINSTNDLFYYIRNRLDKDGITLHEDIGIFAKKQAEWNKDFV
jgi:hypothetical protein